MQRLRLERPVSRREFFSWTWKEGVRVGAISASIPALVAACSREGGPPLAPAPTAAATAATPGGGGAAAGPGERVLVGDVLDHALSSDRWPGEFGFVTFRLHRAAVDGKDAYIIRTDTSDRAFAREEGLVWAPRIGPLVGAGLTGSAYLVKGGPPDQPTVLSTEPGRPDYTPAWRIHRVTWTGRARPLSSEAEVRSAERTDEVRVEATTIVLNAEVVKWSSGGMPVDSEAREYLGGGQLLEAPDPQAGTVTFKLHECFPGVRYIVCDTSMGPMAEGMHVVHSPGLEGGTGAGVTGRTNVFMNGLPGSGPMGFQPSVFDSRAGSPEWSPYWDHMTYAWKEGATPRLLRSEEEVHAARDAGELEEFPGTPDTGGQVFTVNCPVPVLAPNTFTA